MAGFHDVISKLDGNRQILTDGNVDIPFRSFTVCTLLLVHLGIRIGEGAPTAAEVVC